MTKKLLCALCVVIISSINANVYAGHHKNSFNLHHNNKHSDTWKIKPHLLSREWDEVHRRRFILQVTLRIMADLNSSSFRKCQKAQKGYDHLYQMPQKNYL